MIYDFPQPNIRPVPGEKRLYRLQEDYLVQLPYSKKWLLIKAGFLFDGASIPRWLWSIIGNPFDPNWLAAALIHDALYAAELLSRHLCDKELLWAMRRTSKIGRDKARTFFIAVDTFGGWTWRRHTPKSIFDARTECIIYNTKLNLLEGTEP
jgi:hypothetical protein